MKRTTTLFAGFLLLSIALQAQKQSKFITELTMGPSFPVGRFAATSTSSNDKSETPGFAKPGLAAQLSVGYYINKYVGIMVLAAYSEHPQDEAAIQNMIQSYAYGYTVTNLDAKNWKTVKLMVGVFAAVPLTPKKSLVLVPKLTAGISQFSVPQITWTAAWANGTSTSTGNSDKVSYPWWLCYQAGTALQYKFHRNWYLLLDVNYFNTTEKKDISVRNSNGAFRTNSYENKQATINTLAGIGVNF